MEVSYVNVPLEDGVLELTVPSEFFSYRPLTQAERVSSGTRSSLIKFGAIGRATSVYLDRDSGEVLSGVEPGDVALINTSMGKFFDCISRLAEIYPYYPAESEHEDWEAAAQRVQDIVCEVDATAYQEGLFWYEFRWDVSMGDFHD
ncbi:hypothetical protein CLM62_14190 [Streptomyces sp. SA15]|uniref:SUKH-4 family immunity protein n=1 Tax=Streptomyces sp. SA15 TaxID=934019 RepID=UPI000BB03810|nr:SUKH-4 family immunity protein [Streptomyces sp. SA15]PAZ15336.1 hypothetical protein CLM62_14190 [Streptomyces sp. SA15]